MILLDKPLVSDFLRQTIREGHIRALDTGKVMVPPEANLLSEEKALEAYSADPRMNLHTTSENALKWIYDQLPQSHLIPKIACFKNKVAFREMLRDLYPGFFFLKVNLDHFDQISFEALPKPFIIKPATGFFSMSVHKVFDEPGWEKTRIKIRDELENIRSVYPEEVLKLDEYIIEEVIEGEEFAFDAYFDDDGKAVVVGIMHHPFSGEGDVSDRVYNTSCEIVKDNIEAFDNFLEVLEQRAGLRNFSLHVEVRINDQGKIVPIEVNPLRFGAWCTSADLAHYAFGFNPYSVYINKQRPDWEKILDESDGHIYSIIILENSSGIRGNDIKSFDYEKVLGELDNTTVLELRKINFREYPIFGILFIRTAPENYGIIEKMLKADMRDYIVMR